MVGFGKDRSRNNSDFRFLSYVSDSRIKDILAIGLLPGTSGTGAAIDMRTKAITLILSETGCDVRQLASIKAKDFSGDKIRFTEGLHEAPISKELSSVLKQIVSERDLSEDDYLISKEKPISTKRIEQILSGIGLSPKALKDSYAIRNLGSEKRFDFFVPSRKDLADKARKADDLRLELIVHLIADGLSVDDIIRIESGIVEKIKTHEDPEKSENREDAKGNENPDDNENHALIEKSLIKYNVLCQEILREQKHRSRFLLSSRDKPLTRRRIEQLLSGIGCTSKDIERISLVETLARRALEETTGEERELHQKWIRERMLAVRHAGSLEVYRW